MVKLHSAHLNVIGQTVHELLTVHAVLVHDLLDGGFDVVQEGGHLLQRVFLREIRLLAALLVDCRVVHDII